MTDCIDLNSCVNNVKTAFFAAKTAKSEGLRGMYPAATQVLADELVDIKRKLKRLKNDSGDLQHFKDEIGSLVEFELRDVDDRAI